MKLYAVLSVLVVSLGFLSGFVATDAESTAQAAANHQIYLNISVNSGSCNHLSVNSDTCSGSALAHAEELRDALNGINSAFLAVASGDADYATMQYFDHSGCDFFTLSVEVFTGTSCFDAVPNATHIFQVVIIDS